MSQDFGSSLFKLHGEEATPADTLSVLSTLVNQPSARAKCGGLGGLVLDAPLSQREERAENMASIYFSVHAPPEASSAQPGAAGTPAFVNKVCPPPFSKWKNHIRAVYDKRGKASSATVESSEVISILRAIEALWGVPGHLLRV